MASLKSPPERERHDEPGPMVPEPFVVRSKRQDTRDTWTLELTSVADDAGLHFAPGQFTMIEAGGSGEVPISISGDPGEPDVLVHTVRSVGLATQAICKAQPGQVLGVRGPFGNSWPVELLEGRDVVVAAGGIGLAPLRPAILAMIANRERYGRLVLLYGARTASQMLYVDELERWREEGFEVHATVDSAGPEWLGHVGVVTRLIGRARLTASFAGLTCGPEIMMRLTALALADFGIDGEQLYVSTERNMQCGIGHCGHCQLGPWLLCRDGPVFDWQTLAHWLQLRDV
jgi:NAD(P)H-flavin reductase